MGGVLPGVESLEISNFIRGVGDGTDDEGGND